MLTILTGRSGCGKTDLMVQQVKIAAEADERGMIFLVPDQFSHEAERLLCEVCGDFASLHAEVLSFSRLCNRVFSVYGGIARTYLDEGGKVLAMQQALRMAEPETRSFGKRSKQTDYILSLLETASECRSAGITPNDLRKAAADAVGSLRAKVMDTAYVLDIYQGRMIQDLRDPDEKLDRLADMLPDTEYARDISIWVDGFRDFTNQQYRVLRQLLSVCKNMTVSLTLDAAEDESPVFFHARRTREKLKELAEELGLEYCVRSLSPKQNACRPEMRHLEENLFADFPSVFPEKGCVTVRCCNGAGEELEACAAAILDLVESGARYQDIAVAVGGFSGREQYCRRTLESYGIPVYVNQKTDVLQMPAVTAMLAALQIITRGWDYDSMFSYLKTGYAGLSEEECDCLENYVLTWGIQGKQWYENDWDMDPNGYRDTDSSGERQSCLRRLNAVRLKVVEPLVHLQDAMRGAEYGGERIRALFSFVDDIALYDRLQEEALYYKNAGDGRTAEDCLSLGRALTSAAEQYYLTAGDLPCTTPEFASQWQLLLSRCQLGSIPAYLDRLTLGDVRRIRRRGIKHLFVLGMTQGQVPAVGEPRGVFSSAEEDRLRAMHLPLAHSAEERLCASLADAYELLTLPSESLYVSCVPAGGEMPSQLMDTICRIFHVDAEFPNHERDKTAAPYPCLELALANGNSALSRAAKGLLQGNSEFRHLYQQAEKATADSRMQLSDKAVEGLYRKRLSLTASRVNTYQGCPFLYYMQYGLCAREREKAELSPSVIGTFVHYVLENVAKEVKNRGGFSCVDSDSCCDIAMHFVDQYAHSVLGIPGQAGRLRFLFDVVVQDTLAIVRDMAQELSNSDFEPLEFELAFSSREKDKLPAYGLQEGPYALDVRGIVDRVDGWQKDGRLFLRVVDYKTGSKKFKLSEVYHGFDMQMLIYLYALQRFGPQYYGMPVEAAGILYTPAQNKYYTVKPEDSESKIQKSQADMHKRSGLILQREDVIHAMEHGVVTEKGVDYPYLGLKETNGLFTGSSLITDEQLLLLHAHVDKRLLESCRGILSGRIHPKRIRHHGQESCQYCMAAKICRPEKQPIHYLADYAGDELWQRIAGKESNNATTDSNK